MEANWILSTSGKGDIDQITKSQDKTMSRIDFQNTCEWGSAQYHIANYNYEKY